MNKWKEENNQLKRTFEFQNFQAALGFVNLVGVIAEDMKHHPDILLYDYKFVDITTTTHDSGNVITAKDHELANRITGIFDE
jgi:4a-hydroxytetrahydrobiopterin dehydratase